MAHVGTRPRSQTQSGSIRVVGSSRGSLGPKSSQRPPPGEVASRRSPLELPSWRSGSQGQIPRHIRSRFGLTNLFVEDLPSFWRLLYTVTNHESDRYVVVVAIVNHKTYSRWFRRD